jgi:hypothetical protein
MYLVEACAMYAKYGPIIRVNPNELQFLVVHSIVYIKVFYADHSIK